MLSKQQAKMFFLGGTILFVLIFAYLSIDSLANGIPENTKEQNMNELVLKGRLIWDEKNCMGCHTLMGEGAYYAPELTKVYERRGPAYINAVLSAPNGWGTTRKMVKYDFTEEEKKSIIEFLKWCGEMDLNGFPAKPTLKQ